MDAEIDLQVSLAARYLAPPLPSTEPVNAAIINREVFVWKPVRESPGNLRFEGAYRGNSPCQFVFP